MSFINSCKSLMVCNSLVHNGLMISAHAALMITAVSASSLPLQDRQKTSLLHALPSLECRLGLPPELQVHAKLQNAPGGDATTNVMYFQ
jgi:hypothetical protein